MSEQLGAACSAAHKLCVLSGWDMCALARRHYLATGDAVTNFVGASMEMGRFLDYKWKSSLSLRDTD
eukprot:5651180-Amphidinium_carterae.1